MALRVAIRDDVMPFLAPDPQVVRFPLTIGNALDLIGRETRVENQTLCEGAENSQVHLPNGWCVSIGYGWRHYCANYGWKDRIDCLLDTPTCEVAIFDAGDTWFVPHADEGTFIWPHVPASLLLAVVDAVAMFREGGDCPCPDCVKERRRGKDE